MNTVPKIVKAKSTSKREIEIIFEDGIHAVVNFENYFSYSGYYSFLSDETKFLSLKVEEDGGYIYWLNDNNEEIEIDPAILYSICSKEKIIVNGKVVFDPSLGRNARC